MEMGPCTQQWNFLYVQEAAQILVKLLLGKVPAGVYNVAGEDTRPLKAILKRFMSFAAEKEAMNLDTGRRMRKAVFLDAGSYKIKKSH